MRTLHEHGLSSATVADEIEHRLPDQLGLKLGGKKMGAKALAKGSEKLVSKGLAKLGTKCWVESSTKLSGKFAEKLVLQLAPKLALKLGAGSIFVVGAGVVADGQAASSVPRAVRGGADGPSRAFLLLD